MGALRRIVAILGVATIMVFAGAAASAGTGQRQTDPVQSFVDGSNVPGAWSTLVSGASGSSFTLHTTGLEPGHTVTVWWVIFNHPEHCEHGMFGLRCGEADLFDPSVQASVVHATGRVIGGSGSASFAGWIGTGDTDGALFGPGLLRPFAADIHLVVHDHGRLPAAQRAEGIHNFGPCTPECVDVQFSAHER